MISQHAQAFAVGRPVEYCDVLGGEVGDLLVGRAVEGLNPDVVYAAGVDGIGDGFSIWSVLQAAAGNVLIDIHQARRGGIEIEEREFFLAALGFGVDHFHDVGERFSVGGNRCADARQEAAGDYTGGDHFGLAGAIQRGARNAAVGAVIVVDPFSIQRADGSHVEFPVGDLDGAGTIGVRTPNVGLIGAALETPGENNVIAPTTGKVEDTSVRVVDQLGWVGPVGGGVQQARAIGHQQTAVGRPIETANISAE